MNNIHDRSVRYNLGKIDKVDYIASSYDDFHSLLFDYSNYLSETNVSKIEIEDRRVVFTFRDSGVKIICPPGDHRVAPIEAMNFLDYEKDESWMICNLVSDGDTVLDIGANMGYYSVLLASKYPMSDIHCFEPIPDTFSMCTENILINGLSNVNANNFGLSDKDGSFPFYFYPEGSGNASSVNVSGREDVVEISCIVKTLDDYVTNKDLKVDFVKCDVEGAELLTFNGGLGAITRDNPIVFAEILRKYCLKYGYDHNEIFDLFYGLGYKAFTVKGKKLDSFSYMNENTLETNFFFLHATKHQSIIANLTAI